MLLIPFPSNFIHLCNSFQFKKHWWNALLNLIRVSSLSIPLIKAYENAVFFWKLFAVWEIGKVVVVEVGEIDMKVFTINERNMYS